MHSGSVYAIYFQIPVESGCMLHLWFIRALCQWRNGFFFVFCCLQTCETKENTRNSSMFANETSPLMPNSGDIIIVARSPVLHYSMHVVLAIYVHACARSLCPAETACYDAFISCTPRARHRFVVARCIDAGNIYVNDNFVYHIRLTSLPSALHGVKRPNVRHSYCLSTYWSLQPTTDKKCKDKNEKITIVACSTKLSYNWSRPNQLYVSGMCWTAFIAVERI